jgi:hypothetical protein
MFTGFLFSKETCSGSMSKSRPLCYNGPVSTLCYARRKWQGNDGQRNKMEGARCFHSPADYSPAQFPSDHWRFIPGLPVEIVLRGLREVQEHFCILEKFRTFFEKFSRFDVKFRKFFGYFFLRTSSNRFRTRSNHFAGSSSEAFLCKYLQMSGLQNEHVQASRPQSKWVKPV